MLEQEHKERHKKLHEMLDELVADYLTLTDKDLSNSTVMDLVQWSAGQVNNPTPAREDQMPDLTKDKF